MTYYQTNRNANYNFLRKSKLNASCKSHKRHPQNISLPIFKRLRKTARRKRNGRNPYQYMHSYINRRILNSKPNMTWQSRNRSMKKN